MIVKYVRERGYEGRGVDPYLTLGRNYTVVDLTFKPHDSTYYVTLGDEDDEESGGVWDLKFFDIVDGRLPDGWVVTQFNHGIIGISPQEFLGDFWELYHDGDEEAEQVFADVLAKIKAFHADQLLDIG